MISYDIRERLTAYLQSINMSISQLEVLCAFSTRYFNNVRFRVPAGRIDTILRVLPDLNRRWLLTGEGKMTNDLPFASAPISTDPAADNIRFLQRVHILLENEGLIMSEYEASHGMTVGTIDRIFGEGDSHSIDRIALTLIREYPKFSYDWLFCGKGQAIAENQLCLPVVRYPSWYYAQKKTLETASNGNKKEMRVLLGVTRYFSNLSHVTFDPHLFDKRPSLILEVQTHDLTPYVPRGGFVLCQRKTTLFGTRWDYDAMYVVEEKTDLLPQNYSPNQIHFGLIREDEDGIMIKPFDGVFDARKKEPMLIEKEKVAFVGQIIGLVRTKFPSW